MTSSAKIILASASPRRRELLERIGISDFTVFPSSVDETIPENTSPEGAVQLLSKAKAESISEKAGKDAVIIAADTIVLFGGEILGKPSGRDDAFRMLSMLSGQTHEVFTGLCVRSGEKEIQTVERTAVKFRELSDEEINRYIDSGEPFDKAGAYGIQGIGSMLVKSVNGDFYNVMGLPVCALSLILKEFGVDLL
jgi:septum formation protein